MSLCRWSSNNFKCDLYVYEAEDGISINVATNYIIGNVPSITWNQGPEVLQKTYREQVEFLKTAERTPIGGKYDGYSWYGLDNIEAVEILEMLKQEGYNFPESVIEELK